MVSTGRLIAIFSGAIMIVACILYVVSNALPRWGLNEDESLKVTYGLWRGCLSDGNITECYNLPSTCSQELPEVLPLCNKLMVARAFVTTACIMSGLSVLCLFLCAIINKDSKRSIIIISKVLTNVSLIAGVIGVGVGLAYVTSEAGAKIKEAAILGIIAMIINTIGALVVLAIR